MEPIAIAVLTGLTLCYGAIYIWACIQFKRVRAALPAKAWTTQLLFHLLIGLMSFLRCAYWVYLLIADTMNAGPWYIDLVCSSLPSLFYFSTYTLLVLFWVHVYHQAHSIRIASNSNTLHVNMRLAFYMVNLVMLFIQIGIYVLMTVLDQDTILAMNSVFFASWSLLTAGAFLVYGVRLFTRFRNMPSSNESRERLSRMRRVGRVTAIVSICFIMRAVYTLILNADQSIIREHMTTFSFYMAICAYFFVSEVVPSILVLYILRDLPNPQSKVIMIWNKSGLDVGPDYSSGRASPLLATT